MIVYSNLKKISLINNKFMKDISNERDEK